MSTYGLQRVRSPRRRRAWHVTCNVEALVCCGPRRIAAPLWQYGVVADCNGAHRVVASSMQSAYPADLHQIGIDARKSRFDAPARHVDSGRAVAPGAWGFARVTCGRTQGALAQGDHG